MKGNGNGFDTLFEKLLFMLIPTSGGRTRYINKHKDRFKHVGGGLFFQPRQFPTDPELISLGENVNIASDVDFINHDVVYRMLNVKFHTSEFEIQEGCIEIGDNVMIGARTLILPNVKIGSNVIIGAGSIVTKDIPDNTVAAGVPCKPIGKFDEFVIKNKRIIKRDKEEAWDWFYAQREKNQGTND